MSIYASLNKAERLIAEDAVFDNKLLKDFEKYTLDKISELKKKKMEILNSSKSHNDLLDIVYNNYNNAQRDLEEALGFLRKGIK